MIKETAPSETIFLSFHFCFKTCFRLGEFADSTHMKSYQLMIVDSGSVKYSVLFKVHIRCVGVTGDSLKAEVLFKFWKKDSNLKEDTKR